MTNSQRLAAVRRRLEQWLDQYGKGAEPSADSPSPVPSRIRKESILIRGGFFCGRQFDAGDYRAVWFIEEDQLKIYTGGGKWVCSLQGEELVSAADEVATQSTAAPADVLPMVASRSSHSSPDASTLDAAKVGEGVDEGAQSREVQSREVQSRGVQSREVQSRRAA